MASYVTIQKGSPSAVFTLEATTTNRDFFTSIVQLRDGSFLTASHTDPNRATFSMLTPPTLIKRYARKRSSNSNSESNNTSSSSRRLRSYSDGQQLSCIQTFRGHQRLVTGIVEIDSETFASCSGDKSIRIWSLVDATVVQTVFRAHSHHLTALLYLEERKLLVSGSKDGTIKLWRLPLMQMVSELKGHSQPIESLHALDHGLIASNSSDSQIKWWNISRIDEHKNTLAKNIEIDCVRTLEGVSNHVVVFRDGVVASLDRRDAADGDATAGRKVKLWNEALEEQKQSQTLEVRCEYLKKLNDGVFVTVSNSEVVGWNKRGERVFTLKVRSLPDCVIGLQTDEAVAMVHLHQKSVSIYNILDKKMNLVNMCCSVIGKRISTQIEVLSEYLPNELYNHCWYFYQQQSQQHQPVSC